MAKNSLTGRSGRKRQWFARRQVYLRAGQDSQYVELSPLLQIGVALGFGVLALWLIGASYGAASNFLGKDKQAALLAKLDQTEQTLVDVEQERDAALEKSSAIADLEAELADARTSAAEPSNRAADDTVALTTELEQTKAQLEELHLRLSESKADQAALQARFEAEQVATTDADEKTAEEASSLHAQLEEAFSEIEVAQQERDDATATLAALQEQVVAKEEVTERNTALLKAATAEIERLQEAIAVSETEAEEDVAGSQETIGKLERQLSEATSARDELQREVTGLRAELDEAKAAVLEAADTSQTADAGAEAERDAEIQARFIAAELKEADLLATIENLNTEIAAGADNENAVQSDDVLVPDSEEMQALKERVALAEAEVEQLLFKGLTTDEVPPPTPAPEPVEADQVSDEEIERLRSDLLAAEAEIIKLNADVRAGKQRLAERAETEDGQASRPDNSAKLEQQLASTRSRVQQLNKALADAKLREVAIDLALINVVPSPSPPAPR